MRAEHEDSPMLTSRRLIPGRASAVATLLLAIGVAGCDPVFHCELVNNSRHMVELSIGGDDGSSARRSPDTTSTSPLGSLTVYRVAPGDTLLLGVSQHVARPITLEDLGMTYLRIASPAGVIEARDTMILSLLQVVEVTNMVGLTTSQVHELRIGP